MKKVSARYVEVCDIPYCSKPHLFYQRRIEAGLRVKELKKTCQLFDKKDPELTTRDPKLAFLNLYPIKVNLGGEDHEVTVKKLNGQWLLSCNCRSWIFSLKGNRGCKHTEHIENLMAGEEMPHSSSRSLTSVTAKLPH